ncbi:hypothetical protein BZA05DRAFT_444946 [Tricharina praecox]|uniref:uncharacterized protein n=1 Tax=Tricharina praecox TaxID=43433 RepID=UPI0022211253|nr:uncharacterized protein BZA05DRAFT_444946 [Tricharina praecox]KAI5851778.1 hypothetical protein BZA05DRAFT_444946 [Tricharina praecox]
MRVSNIFQLIAMVATVGLVYGAPAADHSSTGTTSLAELEPEFLFKASSHPAMPTMLPPTNNTLESPDNMVPEDGHLTCETSHASPTYFEIGQAIARVSNSAAAKCVQKNSAGSKCSTLGKYKGGQVGICGMHLLDMSCKWIHWAAWKIRFECGNDQIGRAGGKFEFPGGMTALTVIVY